MKKCLSFVLATILMLSFMTASAMSKSKNSSAFGKNKESKLIITDTEREDFLEYLKDQEPGEYQRLLMLEEQDPGEFYKVVHQGARDLVQLKELKEKDPDTYKRIMDVRDLRKETEELALKYVRAADDETRSNYEKELKSNLEKLFDIREEQRTLAIRAMKIRVKTLENQLIKRKEYKDAIIENRFKDVTGQNDFLQW